MYDKISLWESRGSLVFMDIDGVIAVEQNDIPLEHRAVIKGARRALSLLCKRGYRIILYTSRSKYVERETVKWLKKNDIPFDDIIFDKPRGNIYIDDRGYRFSGWKQFFQEVEF
jgi:uncharacterized HAD superfamily protein